MQGVRFEGGSGWGGQGGCEWIIEAFVKIQKKNWGGDGGGGGFGLGCQLGCEQRSKVFVKIQKKKFEGGGMGRGGGVRSGVGWGRLG